MFDIFDRRHEIHEYIKTNKLLSNDETSYFYSNESRLSKLTYYYRNKIYHLIRNYCHHHKLPFYVSKLFYETSIAVGTLVEVETSRVKISSLDTLKYVPEYSNLLPKNFNYKIFISSGTFFSGVLSHVLMKTNFDNPNIILIRNLSLTNSKNIYKHFNGLKKESALLESLISSLKKSNVHVIFTSSSVSVELSSLLAAANITCIAHILPEDLNRLAVVTKCSLYDNLTDACKDSHIGYLGRLIIGGDKRSKIILVSECDYKMGISIFTNPNLINLLQDLLEIIFKIFSEESFINSIDGNIYPQETLFLTNLHYFSQNYKKNPDWKMYVVATRNLKLCGSLEHTFDTNNLTLKSWVKNILLYSTTFGCPINDTTCIGSLFEHTILFTDFKHNIEISFPHDKKLFALPQSKFFTYVQYVCNICGKATQSKPFESNILFLDFIKILLNSSIFCHICLTTKKLLNNNKILNKVNVVDLFADKSKEIFFSLVSDLSESSFPLRISFVLSKFERYKFVPLVQTQCSYSISRKIDDKYESPFLMYFYKLNNNKYLFNLFQFIESLYSFFIIYNNSLDLKNFSFNDFPCKCLSNNCVYTKSEPFDGKSPIDEWCIYSGIADKLHPLIDNINKWNKIYKCKYNYTAGNKMCDTENTKNINIPCLNVKHCNKCNWHCINSWQSLYLYNLILLTHSIYIELNIEKRIIVEILSELYIIHIYFIEFTSSWLEIEFLSKLCLLKLFNKKYEDYIFYNLLYTIVTDTFLSEFSLSQFSPIVSFNFENNKQHSTLGSILAIYYSTHSYYIQDFKNSSLPIFDINIKTFLDIIKYSNRTIFDIYQFNYYNTIFDAYYYNPAVITYYGKTFIIDCLHKYEFLKLRHAHGIEESDFIKSICKLERKISTGGKSGAPLYITHDRRYIIKILNNHEFDFILDKGCNLISYFLNNKNSLLCIPFGCLRISVLSPKKSLFNKNIKCVILQNVDLCDQYCSHEYGEKLSFDLKGVGLHRFNQYSSGDSSPLNDFQSVIGIFESLAIDATREFFLARSNLGRLKSWDSEINSSRSEVGPFEKDIVLWDRNFFEYTKGFPLYFVDNTLNDVIMQIDSDTKLLADLSLVDYSLLLHLYPNRGLLCIGIIDYLRPYTWDKQVETIGKKLANITTGQDPTVLSPLDYKNRFQSQVKQIFSYEIEHLIKSKYNNKYFTESETNNINKILYNNNEVLITNFRRPDVLSLSLTNNNYSMNNITSYYYNEFMSS